MRYFAQLRYCSLTVDVELLKGFAAKVTASEQREERD
jgi:hypothetical protein